MKIVGKQIGVEMIKNILLFVLAIIAFLGWTHNTINYEQKDWHSLSGKSVHCLQKGCEETILLRRNIRPYELCAGKDKL